MSAYLGNAMSIFLVAYLINKDLHKNRVFDVISLNFFESMGTGMMISLINIIPLYICFHLDKALARRYESNFLSLSHKSINIEMQKEIRASSLNIAPKLEHLRQFGKGFWLFNAAYSLQNACLKTSIVLSIPFLVSEWELMTKV
jgi:hypothetical protein